MSLRFDEKVAIVTGAGNGLGKAYALKLAALGARVVINDIGAPHAGSPDEPHIAENVAATIRGLGGEAIANTDSVATQEGGQSIVDSAIAQWGRVDVVIANAGVMRDRSFLNVTNVELSDVITTHLYGTFNVLQPALRSMKNAGNGGHVVLTTSTSGLYGVFGQAAYASAKGALVGLTKVLSLEGARYGVVANAVAPIATTRLMPSGKSDKDRLSVDRVTPFVIALCHETCPANGEVFLVGGGVIRRVLFAMNEGVALNEHDVDDVVAAWPVIRESGDMIELADGMAIVTQLRGDLA